MSSKLTVNFHQSNFVWFIHGCNKTINSYQVSYFSHLQAPCCQSSPCPKHIYAHSLIAVSSGPSTFNSTVQPLIYFTLLNFISINDIYTLESSNESSNESSPCITTAEMFTSLNRVLVWYITIWQTSDKFTTVWMNVFIQPKALNCKPICGLSCFSISWTSQLLNCTSLSNLHKWLHLISLEQCHKVWQNGYFTILTEQS